MTNPIIIDAHEDLACNMLEYGRDYTLSAADTRQREQGSKAPQLTGDTLLGWPDYQRGKVALIFSTLFAAPVGVSDRLGEWDTENYADPEEAHMRYSTQLDAYDRLVERHPNMFKKIEKKSDLHSVLSDWENENSDEHTVGLVVLMEGAEGVREPAEVGEWYQRGVRIIGPAWEGTRFCGGTDNPGPLTKEGYELLEHMSEFNLTLDLSHMDEEAALQALDRYPGPIIASHANALALLKGTNTNRHLTDQVIKGLLERNGTIGILPVNSFLRAGWKDSGGRASVTLDYVVAQMDYICQMAGDARHVGIGSDFDGGFGLQSVPIEIDTIADLRKIIPILIQKGYTQADVEAILSKNWLAYLQDTLPEAI